jgi:hypothetical protein
MKANLVIGIICFAGVYAATNTPAALGVAFTACVALLAGVKWVAGTR